MSVRIPGAVDGGWQGVVMQKRIVQAGNTVVPALLAVEDLGFAIEVTEEGVYARRDQEEYGANDPVALLGLIRLVELRSWEWGASDNDIHEAMRRYGLA